MALIIELFAKHLKLVSLKKAFESSKIEDHGLNELRQLSNLVGLLAFIVSLGTSFILVVIDTAIKWEVYESIEIIGLYAFVLAIAALFYNVPQLSLVIPKLILKSMDPLSQIIGISVVYILAVMTFCFYDSTVFTSFQQPVYKLLFTQGYLLFLIVMLSIAHIGIQKTPRFVDLSFRMIVLPTFLTSYFIILFIDALHIFQFNTVGMVLAIIATIFATFFVNDRWPKIYAISLSIAFLILYVFSRNGFHSVLSDETIIGFASLFSVVFAEFALAISKKQFRKIALSEKRYESIYEKERSLPDNYWHPENGERQDIQERISSLIEAEDNETLAIGISGRRGLGKTNLLLSLQKIIGLDANHRLKRAPYNENDLAKDNTIPKNFRIKNIALFVPCPSDYDEISFLSSLLEKLAHAVNRELTYLLPAVAPYSAEQEKLEAAKQSRPFVIFGSIVVIALVVCLLLSAKAIYPNDRMLSAIPNIHQTQAGLPSYKYFALSEEIHNSIWDRTKTPILFLDSAFMLSSPITNNSEKASKRVLSVDSVEHTLQNVNQLLTSKRNELLRYEKSRSIYDTLTLKLVDDLNLNNNIKDYQTGGSQYLGATLIKAICLIPLIMLFISLRSRKSGKSSFYGSYYDKLHEEINLHKKTLSLLDKLKYSISYGNSISYDKSISSQSIPLVSQIINVTHSKSEIKSKQERSISPLNLIDEFKSYVVEVIHHLRKAVLEDGIEISKVEKNYFDDLKTKWDDTAILVRDDKIFIDSQNEIELDDVEKLLARAEGANAINIQSLTITSFDGKYHYELVIPSVNIEYLKNMHQILQLIKIIDPRKKIYLSLKQDLTAAQWDIFVGLFVGDTRKMAMEYRKKADVKIIVLIDELDKITSSEKLVQMLRMVKALLELRGVYYVVSISDEMTVSDNNSVLLKKNEILNSLSYTVDLVPMSYYDSRTFFTDQNISPEPALYAAVMSGGVPREMHRIKIDGDALGWKEMITFDGLHIAMRDRDQIAIDKMILDNSMITPKGKSLFHKLIFIDRESSPGVIRESVVSAFETIDNQIDEYFIGDKNNCRKMFYEIQIIIYRYFIMTHIGNVLCKESRDNDILSVEAEKLEEIMGIIYQSWNPTTELFHRSLKRTTIRRDQEEDLF